MQRTSTRTARGEQYRIGVLRRLPGWAARVTARTPTHRGPESAGVLALQPGRAGGSAGQPRRRPPPVSEFTPGRGALRQPSHGPSHGPSYGPSVRGRMACPSPPAYPGPPVATRSRNNEPPQRAAAQARENVGRRRGLGRPGPTRRFRFPALTSRCLAVQSPPSRQERARTARPPGLRVCILAVTAWRVSCA